MLAPMMESPLLISGLMEFGVVNHPEAEIVSRKVEDNSIHRITQLGAAKRTRQLANALLNWGVKPGDRIATLAWNTWRHYEVYYATAGIGSICHTINPRLFPEQLEYIFNHAEDRMLFIDLNLLPLVEALRDKLPHLQAIVVMCDKEYMPDSKIDGLICYEEFIAPHSESFEWPQFDESTPCSLCYTSGTTGNPKGVMYTHRSTVLHAMGSLHAQALDIKADSVILPVVPMFHVNAWGIPYAVTITGAKLVFPGAAMDGASLWELIKSEEPTLLAGVPTVWLGLLNHLDSIGETMHSVQTVVVGGSAAPLSMIKAFDEKHDAFLLHAWGMTEMSPIGTVNAPTKAMLAMPKEERYQQQRKQGRPVYGVDMKIIDDDGNELPRDGKAYGRLMVRGPWIVNSYYKSDKLATENGWFDTGDVATIDSHNTMQIVDRSKDVIKSGGEWISSIDLENVAVGHPAVAEACVIGIPHEKWQERPLLLVVLKDGASASEADILDYLKPQLASFWVPDAVVFRDDLPHTATGKLLKVPLREEYADFYIKK
ncbi:long-chain fatty acid--CoA ligase [Litorivivens sp.]|uniref:long-chain fatty acid--CoA ligase n=2 Tax=Litorivivens sp. TaxID=2020868 RepID=UPI00356731D8